MRLSMFAIKRTQEQTEIINEMILNKRLPHHVLPLVYDLLRDCINANFIEERLIQLDKRIPELVSKYRETL